MSSEKCNKRHNFHFVVARSMRDSLGKLNVFNKRMSLSGIIVKILTELGPVIKVEHKWGEQRMSRYMCVSPDPIEERDHVHAYLDKDMYRELKLIHQDLNFYSIAQIVRGFLEFFLELVDEYGDDIFNKLKSVFKEWKKEADATRLTLRQNLIQLSNIIRLIPGKQGLLNVYDSHFTPFWILRL